MSDFSENNKVGLTGEIVSLPEFNHEVYGEKFYIFELKVMRLSGIADNVRVLVSERLFGNDFDIKLGEIVTIKGQFRSYNNYTGEGNRLILTVFAKDIGLATLEDAENPNHIFLDGYICKAPIYRVTPFSREISDVLIAVNRSYNKSDYIPVISWGRNARFCRDLPVGTRVRLWGRIQSREYQKRISDDEAVTKVAYEVSVGKMEIVE